MEGDELEKEEMLKRGGKRRVGVKRGRRGGKETEKKKRRFLWKVGVTERAGDYGSTGDWEGCQVRLRRAGM